MSTAKRVITNTIYLYVRMGVSLIASFFTTRILLQSLGVSDYGLYNVVAGALGMMGFLSATLCFSTQRFISYAEGKGDIENIKQIFNTSVFLHIIIASITCFIYIIAGFFFFCGILNIPDGRLMVAILVYGCLIFSTVFTITIAPYDAVLNAHENMKYYSLLGISDVLLKLIIAISSCYVSSDKLIFYAVSMAIESWLFRFITQQYCKYKYLEVLDVKFKKYVKKNILIEMSSFVGWTLINVFTGMIGLFGMNVIMNHYYGTTVNAAMGVATQLAGAILGVTANMTKALTPVLVKEEGKSNRSNMINISYVGCKFSFLLLCFFCIPIIFCIDGVLKIWLVEVPEYTKMFCILVMASTLFEQLTYFLQNSVSAQGDIRGYSLWKALCNSLSIPLTIVAFEYGAHPSFAIIIRILTFVMLGNIVNLIFSKRKIELSILHYLTNVLLPCSITLFAASVCCTLLRPQSNDVLEVLSHLAVMLLVSVPVYYVIALDKREKSFVVYSLKKIIKR